MLPSALHVLVSTSLFKVVEGYWPPRFWGMMGFSAWVGGLVPQEDYDAVGYNFLLGP